jgi:hypothetical protein
MDNVTALNMAARKVAHALMRYAEKKGWRPDDYRVYVRFNEDWDTMHFVLVSREFEGQDNYESYQDVWRHLEDSLKDDPELLRSIYLVVKDFKQAEQGGIFGVGPDYDQVPMPVGS